MQMLRRLPFPFIATGFALALRLLAVFLTRHLGIGLDDMFQYDMLARSLATSNGYRWYAPSDLARLAPYLNLDVSTAELDPRGVLTTFRAPLYPALLALIYTIFGLGEGRFLAARVVQSLLGALLVPLTYLTARHVLDEVGYLKPGRSAEMRGRMAAIFIAAYPLLLVFPLALATENLFIPLVLASVLALFKVGELCQKRGVMDPDGKALVWNAVLAGFLLGLAALTRSIILPFAGLGVMWIWLVMREPRVAAITALSCALTISPWIVRNSMLSHKLTGIESSMGYNLYVGYHPESTGTFAFGPSLDLLSISDDQTREQAGIERAIAFVKADPGRFPYLALRRLGHFFDLEFRAFTYFYGNDFLGVLPRIVLLVILGMLALPFVIVSLSATFGAAALPFRPETILLVLLFVSYLLPHVFILSEERFHLTLLPFLAICGANAWIVQREIIGSRRFRLTAGIVCSVLLAVNWTFQLARQWRFLGQLLGPNGNRLYPPY